MEALPAALVTTWSEDSGWTDPIGWVAPAATLVVVVAALFGARWLLEQRERAREGRRFGVQMAMLGLTLVGAVAVILSLPIAQETRYQLLSFLGLLLSAAIALSSTTFLGNVLAGLMLRSMRNLRLGDFVRCEEHFGRISQRGLFHVEIQTIDRDLTTLPNMFLATHPTTVVRSSGTIVSAAVSLGYDVGHGDARALLARAAERAGLTEPFVRVTELGDYTVEYRVGGLLTEVGELLSTKTKLHIEMLDALHTAGVEVASPALRSVREYAAEHHFVPVPKDGGPANVGGLEAIAFDKAEAASSRQGLQDEIDALEAERGELEKRRADQTQEIVRGALDDELRRLEGRLESLRAELAAREAEAAQDPD